MAQNEDASEQQEQETQQASATTSYENSLEQVPIYSRYTPAVRESRLAGIHAPPQPVNPRAETPRHGLLSGCSVFVGRSTVGDAPSEVPKPENADEDTFYYVDDVDDDSAVSNAAADLLARNILKSIAQRENRNASVARYVMYNPPVSWRASVSTTLGEALPISRAECARVVANLGREVGPSLALVAFRWLVDNADYQPDVHGYNDMLETCRSRNDPHGAFEILNDLLARGSAAKADITTLNNVLAVCGQNGLMEQALEVYSIMRGKTFGVQPNSFTFQLLVSLCGYKRRSDWSRAIWAFQEMLDAGVDVDPLTPKELLTVCVRAMRESTGGSDSVVEIFEGLRSLDMADLPVVHDALIYEHARRGELEQALKRFHELPECGVSANADTYNALLLACRRVGAWRQSLEVFEWLVQGVHSMEGFVTPTTETFNAIISTLREAGCLEKALEVFAWMEGYGVEVDMTTYDELIAAVDVARVEDLGHLERKKHVPAHLCVSHTRLEVTNTSAVGGGGGGRPAAAAAAAAVGEGKLEHESSNELQKEGGGADDAQKEGGRAAESGVAVGEGDGEVGERGEDSRTEDTKVGEQEVEVTALDLPIRPIVFDGMRWLYMERRAHEVVNDKVESDFGVRHRKWDDSVNVPRGVDFKEATLASTESREREYGDSNGVLLPVQRQPDKMAERANRTLLLMSEEARGVLENDEMLRGIRLSKNSVREYRRHRSSAALR